MATIAERVLEALKISVPLDDDGLAARLEIRRQSVNQTARGLEAQGKVRRYIGPDGKIVNALTAGVPVVRTSVAPAPPRAQSSHGDVITEDEVKTALRSYLEAQGYDVQVAWGRTRGIDIDARRPGHRLVVEAKGQVRTPGPQQVNYFLGALGELLQRMDDPAATYGLALPDHRQYRRLVERLPNLVRQRLGLVVYFVSRDRDAFVVDEDRA